MNVSRSPDCGKEKRGRNCPWAGGGREGQCGRVSWDDWLAMADIRRMARTKRTECPWSQSLTGCVHYRWLRDWFVSLSKTRAHRRRRSLRSSLTDPRCRGPGTTWRSFRRFILVQRTQPERITVTILDEPLSEVLIPAIDNVEASFRPVSISAVRFVADFGTSSFPKPRLAAGIGISPDGFSTRWRGFSIESIEITELSRAAYTSPLPLIVTRRR